MRRFALLLGLALVGCHAAPDYGHPTSDTHIEVRFGGVGFHGRIEVRGTTLVLQDGERETTRPIARIVVADMIAALAEARVLDSNPHCTSHPDDATIASVDVRLAAGSNRIGFPLGCEPALETLVRELQQPSGYTDFAAAAPR